MNIVIDNEMLWRQYKNAFDALEKALNDWPDELWEAQLWPDQHNQWM